MALGGRKSRRVRRVGRESIVTFVHLQSHRTHRSRFGYICVDTITSDQQEDEQGGGFMSYRIRAVPNLFQDAHHQTESESAAHGLRDAHDVRRRDLFPTSSNIPSRSCA